MKDVYRLFQSMIGMTIDAIRKLTEAEFAPLIEGPGGAAGTSPVRQATDWPGR
jgi:hypothetical protein